MDRAQQDQVRERQRGLDRVRRATAWTGALASALAVIFGAAFAHARSSVASDGAPAGVEPSLEAPPAPTGTRPAAPQPAAPQPTATQPTLRPPVTPPTQAPPTKTHTKSGGS
jgi:hypothetical protein